MKKTRKGKLDTFIKKAIENEEDDGEREPRALLGNLIFAIKYSEGINSIANYDRICEGYI